MTTPKSFTIDLADPSNLGERLPEAEAKLDSLEQELKTKFSEVVRWRRMVAAMQTLARAGESDGSAIVPATADHQHLTELQTRVVNVVTREVRKIRAKDVTDILHAEGFPISGDSVSNCLWHVAEKVKPSPIKRVDRGFYAPHEYQEGDLTPAEAAGSILAGVGVGALAASAAHSLLKAGGN